MSRALRRVLTAKMLALSALVLAGLVMSVVWRRRQLDADSSSHPGHEGYPPHVKPDGEHRDRRSDAVALVRLGT